MEKYIENLIRGSFEYESERLVVSDKKIESSSYAGVDCDGAFTISCLSSRTVNLSVRVSDLRIRISVKEYEGSLADGLEVLYSVSTKGLDTGYVFKGEIYIISDLGEITIPLVIEIRKKYIESSAGTIKNLFHFTNLARSDFDEAVNVFYSEEFASLFDNTEKAYRLKYKGFSNGVKTGENVEEFLISVNKKTPVVYSFGQENISLSDVEEDETGRFEIRRSGWGYTSFVLETDCDFLELEKTEFSSSDFVSSSLVVEYRIRAARLHAGINYGSIRLHSSHTDIYLPVFIGNGIENKEFRDRDIRYKKLIYELTSVYIRFRIRDIGSNAWINMTSEIVEKLLDLDMNNLEVRLYQVHSLVIANRDREASILLDKIETEFKLKGAPADLKGYYIYLRAMTAPDDEEIKEAVQAVWELYESHRDSDRLLWILLYLDASIKISPLRERELLLKQFERGSFSPLLLIEAYSLYSKEPEELNVLDHVEIRILYFAVRHGLFKRSLAERATLLSSRVRGFDELLLKVLSAYYEEFEDDDCLTAICSYLIRNEKTDRKYLKFFRAAVDRELKITNLYEYFLYALPENEVSLLPKSVLIYFSLESALPAPLTAYVFANMIVHEAETSVLLSESRTRMMEFALNEIKQARIDENLAVIYDYLGYFKDSDFGMMETRSSVDSALTEVAFIRLIRCRDMRAHYCIVVEGQLKNEKKYLLKDGAAYIKVCGNDYEIFFENEKGERFTRTNSGYDEIPLLHTQTAVRQIDSLAQKDISLTVYMCERGRRGFGVDNSNVVFVRRAIESDEIDEIYKNEIRMELLRFYFDSELNEDLDSFICSIDIDRLRMEERSELIRIMLMREMSDKAYLVVTHYGVSGIDSRTMVRLLSELLVSSANESYDWLICMCYYVFNEGKYNDLILAYLINHYDGTTGTLRKIWKAGENFELDVRAIEERIVAQMLKTGSFIGERDDIFFDYVKRGAALEIEYAYLSYNAYGYFVKERITDDRIFAGLLDMFEERGSLNDVCMLSLIKYYSDKARDDRMKRIIGGCIRRCLEKNIIFSFFSEYVKDVSQLRLYADLSFVEYRTNPKNRVVLHYILNDGTDGRVNYTKEEMSNVYGGIFSRKFVLFQGERLQYYITEEAEGTENLTESGVLEKEIELKIGNPSRYDMLNEIILCQSLEDHSSMVNAYIEYLKKKAVKDVILGGLQLR